MRVLLSSLLTAATLCAADPTLVNLIGPDAKVIAGADIDRVKNSPLGQFVLSQLKMSESEMDKVVEMTGFDPRRDLREVLVATRGTGKDGEPVMFLRGTFDQSRIAALVATHGGEALAYQGFSVLTGPSGGKDHPWIAFAGTGIVAGQEAAVKAALDRQRAGQKTDPALAARLQSVSSRYDAWVFSTVSPADLAPKPGPATGQSNDTSAMLNGTLVQGIEEIAIGFKLGAMIEIGGEATARSDKDAQALVDVVKFLASMAASNQPPSAPTASILNSFQASADGRTVKFAMSVPQNDIEKLLPPSGGRVMKKKPVVLR